MSECLSPGAEDWIRPWRHNGLGWFNRVVDAASVVPVSEQAAYRLFAYRLHPELFRAGERLSLDVPDDVGPEPLPAGCQSLGFDAASKSSPAGLSLECSPLSCNGLAGEMPVNEHCLFATIDDAIAGAQRFAVEQPEPGDYYVVEVLEVPDWRMDSSRSTNADRAST